MLDEEAAPCIADHIGVPPRPPLQMLKAEGGVNFANISWFFGTCGEPGDTRGDARSTVRDEHRSRCSSDGAFPPDVLGAA
jgi:hypothetical protein